MHRFLQIFRARRDRKSPARSFVCRARACGSMLLLLTALALSAETPDPLAKKEAWRRQFSGLSAGVQPIPEANATPREDVKRVTEPSFEYSIRMGGTLDGPSTRSPRGYAAWAQNFQPMRRVRIENLGETDLVNPRLSVNGKRQWGTAQDLVDSALRAYGNPTNDADKARAIYHYYIQNRFHASTFSRENDDPVKMLNVYGYSICNNDGTITMDLYRTAGLKVRYGYPAGHVAPEVFYDERWHLLDSDQSMYFLLPDNRTIAGDEDVAHDHDLVKRVHSYSVNFPDDPFLDEFCASAYFYEGRRGGQYSSKIKHTMDLTLRPGEALEWGFARKEGRKFYAHGSGDLRNIVSAAAGRLVYNGRWIYTPPLHSAAARRVHSQEGVSWGTRPGEPAVRPSAAGAPGHVVWKIAAPYVLVGGSARAEIALGETDRTELSLSFDDGKTWTKVENWAKEGSANGVMTADLDPWFPHQIRGRPRDEAARYSYLLRLTLLAGANPERMGLKALTIENVLQMAPLSLPELELGENKIAYRDQTTGPRMAQVSFHWIESSAAQPPKAVAAPVHPADAAHVEGTQVVFEWKPAEDPDGNAIVDYEFQLGDRPDLPWPLSPNFHKLSSNTADEKLQVYTTPRIGLLNPGQPYYWRVRALNAKGVWSPWSKVWSFIPDAPGVPRNLRWSARDERSLTLAWDAHPDGQPPVRYEIYASNEKGFTVQREPYLAYTGNQKSAGLFPGALVTRFEANFLQTVERAEATFRPTRAFYRVVAVDAKGRRSGASEFLAAPRPFIFSEPVAAGVVGQPYRYQVQSLASIGDLRSHKGYTVAFWDAEQPVYTLLQGPDWLKMDAKSGLLSGTPNAAGAFEIAVNAVLGDKGDQATQRFTLRVNP